MTNQPAPQIENRLSDIADSLDGVVKGLNELTGYGRRTRKLTWFAIISFIVDILLTLAFAFALSSSQLNACKASDDARNGQIIIWHTIVTQFADPHQSARQRTDEANFLRFIDKTFKPLRCHSFYLP